MHWTLLRPGCGGQAPAAGEGVAGGARWERPGGSVGNGGARGRRRAEVVPWWARRSAPEAGPAAVEIPGDARGEPDDRFGDFRAREAGQCRVGVRAVVSAPGELRPRHAGSAERCVGMAEEKILRLPARLPTALSRKADQKRAVEEPQAEGRRARGRRRRETARSTFFQSTPLPPFPDFTSASRSRAVCLATGRVMRSMLAEKDSPGRRVATRRS